MKTKIKFQDREFEVDTKAVVISTNVRFIIPFITAEQKKEIGFEHLLYGGYYNNSHIPSDLIKNPSAYDYRKKLEQEVKDTFRGTLAEINVEIANCKTKAKEFEKINDADYKMVYPDRSAEFTEDLYEYHDVTGNPKADKAYSFAYSHGHSAGFSEVANYFSEVVELIK